MKRTLLLLIAIVGTLALWLTCTNCRTIRRQSDARPVTHERWDRLLKQHVDAQTGMVDYRGFLRDSAELNRYLGELEGAHPDSKRWSRAEQMAYWINAYNAYTVQLILRHYPVASIKDIKNGVAFVNSVWDIKFIKIQNYTYDLNNIEHNILRPVFKDARIHAAVNCASFSCPVLRPEAYTAARLDEQLTEQMTRFINDPKRNRVGANKAEVSEIFKWFAGDFRRDAGSVRDYVNRYAKTPAAAKTELSYIDYDWKLNDKN